MRLLAIDPGFAILGYAIFEDGKLLECGTITTSKKLDYGNRLLELNSDLLKLFCKADPQEIAIEKLFVHGKFLQIEGVSAARGCVFMRAAQLSLPVHEYEPAAVKYAIARKGNANKKEMQEAVSKLLHVPVIQPDDAADAVAIGLTHLQSAGRQATCERSKQ